MSALDRTLEAEAHASATIMVVEDDADLEYRLSRALRISGYEVLTAATGAEARGRVSEAQPDLIIMDLVLPDTDGLLLIEAFRNITHAQILICSARQRQVDRLLGLQLGAADFISKPFDMDELVARVDAVLRRSVHRQSLEGDHIWVGKLLIQPRRGTVSIDGRAVHLTPTEHRLLLRLASEPETVFARETLTQQVWGYPDLDCGHLVDVHVGRLRSKLRAAAPDREYLVTVRGLGYRLTSDTARNVSE